MYSKPIDIIQFDIRPPVGTGRKDVKIAYEDLGFIPEIGDVLTSYKWFGGRKIRVRIMAREYETDVGVMRLFCDEIDYDIIREHIPVAKVGSNPGTTAKHDQERGRPRGRPPKGALSPYLSTDGTGREKMTADNYDDATKIGSTREPAGKGEGEDVEEEAGAN